LCVLGGAAGFFKRLFDGAGIPKTVYPFGNERANISAILKGDGNERPLILLNHLDTVRADPSDWRVSLFSGEIVNRELWGRGAIDMKGLALPVSTFLSIATFLVLGNSG
jgi:acetylornithine deacetylase/succinyl-diaminopimelate desuccinylase-like protein